jgi:hypothetical protein
MEKVNESQHRESTINSRQPEPRVPGVRGKNGQNLILYVVDRPYYVDNCIYSYLQIL